MDIESFNRELAKKVAIANSHEKNDELKKAIDAWIVITEMTLKASKDPKIESTYRTMLINKTEQIVQHIKELKVKLVIPKPVPEIELPQVPIDDQVLDDQDIDKESPSSKTHKIVEDSDIKGMPEGFLEIKASNDFKILTPHRELNGELIKDARKIYKLDSEESESENKVDDKISLKRSGDDNNKICFACGTENPPNAKTCKSCKIDLA
ncbi:MAG: hypothetical protein ACFFBP_02570 [Promethearchaeota archaeon]